MMKWENRLEYDVRVIERNLRDKVLTKQELAKYLEGLPDLVDQACLLVIDGELDEDSEDRHNKP